MIMRLKVSELGLSAPQNVSQTVTASILSDRRGLRGLDIRQGTHHGRLYAEGLELSAYALIGPEKAQRAGF